MRESFQKFGFTMTNFTLHHDFKSYANMGLQKFKKQADKQTKSKEEL